MKVFRPGRCAICGKGRGHDVHAVVRRVPVWRRLLCLAWPRWMWTSRQTHAFLERDRRVRASETVARLRRELGRSQRALTRRAS